MNPLVALVGVGTASVVVGGLVSAATGPLDFSDGSWLAAYLVLVCGVAQCAMGLAQEYLGVRRLSASVAWAQFACWNLGNASVILGTLGGSPAFVDIGGLVLLVALAISLHATRRVSRTLLGWGYRLVVAILAVSIPIGIVLAHTRT